MVIWNVTPCNVVLVLWLNIAVPIFRTDEVKAESSVLKTEPEVFFRMLVFVCIL
jgi:hypothetical protein